MRRWHVDGTGGRGTLICHAHPVLPMISKVLDYGGREGLGFGTNWIVCQPGQHDFPDPIVAVRANQARCPAAMWRNYEGELCSGLTRTRKFTSAMVFRGGTLCTLERSVSLGCPCLNF